MAQPIVRPLIFMIREAITMTTDHGPRIKIDPVVRVSGAIVPFLRTIASPTAARISDQA